MNYIKIKKGTFEAFNKLASKDPETIYFIVDPATNKSAIYIGDIPVVGENAINNFNLTKLNDVKMNELKDGYVLTYNAKSKTWEGQEPLIGAIISQSSDSNEIEELKKENQLLKSQLEEFNKELSIQTKNIKTLFANVAKLNQSSSGNATAIFPSGRPWGRIVLQSPAPRAWYGSIPKPCRTSSAARKCLSLWLTKSFADWRSKAGDTLCCGAETHRYCIDKTAWSCWIPIF